MAKKTGNALRAGRTAILALSVIFTIFALVNLAAAPPQPADWWNTSWHYRIRIDINNTDYARDYWPVEQDINFTDILIQRGLNTTFDINSTRVVEYNSTGGVISEMTSQFDTVQEFNASTNAAGTIVFILNGTTTANASRQVYIYFDTIENGAKNATVYPTDLNYSWNDGEEAIINNTIFTFKIDTNRGENTSGLYDVRGRETGNTVFWTNSHSSHTKEYVQYWNGTDNLTFDFRNNATFRSGPVRIVMEQNGDEVLWGNPDVKTNVGKMTKRYIFYDLFYESIGINTSWIRIQQNFTNLGASTITRNSTDAGALAVEINVPGPTGYNSFFGNDTNPGSWYGAAASRGVGIINENQTGTFNYHTNITAAIGVAGRIGITLDNTSIPSGGEIIDTAIMQFGDPNYNEPMLRGLRDAATFPPVITVFPLDIINYEVNATTNYTIYNRNETVLIIGNTTFDPNNITYVMNATIDMGTAATSDDLVLELYDDGDASHGDATANDKIFSNYLNLSENSSVGTWNVTIRAYDSFGVLLNISESYFNVTDTYNVTLSIDNSEGFVDRLVNATLTIMNFRKDTYIPGASVSCSYNSTSVSSITDYNNGTYVINFTAPSVTGGYLLNCSVSKINNSGSSMQYFWTETAKTNMTINVTPANYTTQNISVYAPDSFEISANTTDMGGANARSVNISLSFPQNLSANVSGQQCGIVPMGGSCIKIFNVTIANRTAPGNYTFNITAYWQNPDATTNMTNASVTVYVLSNPHMDVFENNVSGRVADGTSEIIGNFTVRSFGNTNVTNTTFNVTGLDNFTIVFNPVNVSSILPDMNSSISVNVSVPADTPPGNYSGIINVSSGNAGWDTLELNITVPSETVIDLGVSPSNHTSQNISVYLLDWFNLTVNATDSGEANARYVSINLSMPQNLSANSTGQSCGNISAGASCVKMFNITVTKKTAPGNYTFNITAYWQNPDATTNSTNTSVTVYVTDNPRINAFEPNVSGTVTDGTSSIAGNFTVRSFGNANATNITFNVTGGLSNFTVIFTPLNISEIQPDMNVSVLVNVSAPLYTIPGNYTGIVNVSSVNGGWDTLELNLTVPRRLDWTAEPTYCTAIETYLNGTICEVTVTNTGNDLINFTVSPSSFNYTSPNETAFNISSAGEHHFSIVYNITVKDDYTATFNITPTTAGASPSYIEIATYITASNVPLVFLQVTPQEAAQLANIEILANVTDRSATGINYTEINITLPNSTTVAFNMTRLSISGNRTQWYFNYSGNMSNFTTLENATYTYTGSTVSRGVYSLTVYSQDNLNLNATGTKASSFNIYAKLSPVLSLGKADYYQGETGSIYYNLTEATGAPLSSANASFALYVPSLNLYMPSPDRTRIYTTGADGLITLIGEIKLASDSPVGAYNLTANVTYFDDIVNKTLNVITDRALNVQSGSGGGGGGIDVDLETAVVWYPQNVVSFDMWFSFNGNATDPDYFEMLVNHSITGALLFNVSNNSTTKTGVGHYQYLYALSPSTPTGPYKATITAGKKGYVKNPTKYFRIASAGPYDLRLTMLESEIERPGDISFEVTIVNNGEVGQDVSLQYWVTYDNQTWDNKNEVYFTPANANTTITRSMHVYSDQPLGMTTLNVKMYYDQWQQPIIANATFNVIESFITIPPPPPVPPWAYSGGGGGSAGSATQNITVPVIKRPPAAAGEEGTPDLEIVNYPRQVNIIRGWTDIQSVEIRNNGDATVGNITLDVTGIPDSWVSITPKFSESIPPGNNTIFLLEFKIPKTADAGEYGFTISAKSDTSSDEKVGKLSVFTAIEELVRNDIKNLKIELQQLQDDTDFAEKLGKKVENVREIIETIGAEIKAAEDNVAKDDYDKALTNTQTASNLIKRGRQLLESATAPPVVKQVQPTPVWLVGLISLIILLIIGGIIILYLKKRGKIVTLLAHLPKVHEKGAKGEGTAAPTEEIALEKEKLERMNRLLEQELKEGLLTQSVYDELKRLNDEKLAKLEKLSK